MLCFLLIMDVFQSKSGELERADMIETVGSPDGYEYKIAFSSKTDGNMSSTFGAPEEANQNKVRFFTSLGLNSNEVQFIRPTHSNRITLLSKDNPPRIYAEPQILDCDFSGYRDGCDGIVSFQMDTPLAVATGDCIPLLLWCSRLQLFGIIHIGFVNLVNQAAKSLSPLLHDCGVLPQDVSCYFGPAIGKEHYDLAQSGLWQVIAPQVHNRSPEVNDYMRAEHGALFMDMQSLLKKQLMDIGILSDRIRIFKTSTAAGDSNFFSNFRARHTTDKNGRFLTLIAPKY